MCSEMRLPEAVPRLGIILMDSGACTAQAVELALRNQGVRGGRLGTNLLDLGLATEEQLALGLESHHRRPCLRGRISIDPSVAGLLGRDLAASHDVVPYAVSGRKIMVLACDPDDLQMLDDLTFALGREVKALLAPQARIWWLLRSLYGIERGLRGVAVDFESMGPLRAPPPVGTVAPGWRSRARASRFIDDAEFQELCRDRIEVPGPEPARPAPPRLGDALRIVESGPPDEVLRALLDLTGARFSRAVLLTVRPGTPGAAVGWAGMGAGLDQTRVRQLVVALGSESIVAQAVSCRAPVLGPLPPTEANRQLASDLGGDAPLSALAIPVLVQGRPVAVLYADGGPRGSIGGDVGDLLLLVGMAGRALGGRLARVQGRGPTAEGRSR